MEGWVSLHRKLKNWEWYTEPNTFRLFLHCLLSANHKDNNWRGLKVKKGSFITSNDSLSKELGLSVQQIRTAIKKLKSTNEITIKTTNKNTCITLINWELYQDNKNINKENNKQSNKQTTNKQQTNNKQITTNNNDNNKNNEDNIEKLFNLFWSKYPKKVAKKECFKKFKKIKQEDINIILSTIDDFIKYKPFKDYNHPNPSTYLNQERWKDQIKPKEEEPKSHRGNIAF